MKTKIKTAAVLTAIAVLFTVLVCTVDVQPAGESETPVGLSHINEAVFESIGTNMAFYKLTQALGYAALGIVCAFALFGLCQWIKRRNLLKVDSRILVLGGFYIVVLALYVLFEKAAVNFRPIIMPGCTEPEASFPSSHTVLVCTVCSSAAIIFGDYVRNRRLLSVLRILLGAMIAVMLTGRFISGVHWLTDIVAGVLISAALIAWFCAVKTKFAPEEKKKQ